MVTDSKNSCDVTKIIEELKMCQEEVKSTVTKHNEDTVRIVRRLHEEILETSDVKILESVIENQSALTAKNVVDSLRTLPAFSRIPGEVSSGSSILPTRPKDFEDKMIGHFASFVSQVSKTFFLVH
jgi:hypothetical protein